MTPINAEAEFLIKWCKDNNINIAGEVIKTGIVGHYAEEKGNNDLTEANPNLKELNDEL